jgi:hypothetical protein
MFVSHYPGILVSGHTPLVFFLLGNARTRKLTYAVDKFIDMKHFQSLASELIVCRIQINFGKDDPKVAGDFTASIASAHWLLTSKITFSKLNNDLPGLESLLKHEMRLWKLQQVTQHVKRYISGRQNHQMEDT